ncbi:hypothetical protein PVAP13_1KG501900 [Panicum virgatum]|uniref:Uncharacterized protein n=1 Tax=Panicum virgatum TaxID=38727 RepID=A0A8T0XW83_PANVG|nr:hypothetical protein PVAP13_1KG501900 [Panicum virgatum]
MQASTDPPPAKAAAAAPCSVTAPTPPRPGKAEKGAKPGSATTLLDVQEVEWITRELERLLAREQSGADDAGGGGRHRRRKLAKLSPAAPKRGGFVADLLGRHAVSICGGDNGTADGSAAAAGVSGGGRWRGGRRSFREVEKV